MSKLRRVYKVTSTILLILLFLGSAVLSGYYLRQNNLRMLELREAVFTADKNNQGIDTALSELQVFVVSHMNTTLPKLGKEKAVQLKFTYERVVKAETARLSAARTSLSNEATEYCQKTFATSSFAVRAQCVQDYFASHPITELKIPKDPYGYDFVTPVWSADAAGIALLATLLLGLILVFKLFSWIIVRRSLKSKV